MIDQLVGKTLGRYQIVRAVGQGGMSVVYEGFDDKLRRTVAVKVLPAQLGLNAQFKERFAREARTIAALEHPAIVPVYDYGEEEGQLFLIMKIMPGGSLADRLRKGGLSLAETARILVPIAAALDSAHAGQIVHRDIKPSNILFDAQGNPALGDFGIAKILAADTALTGSGILGTPAYLSPEMARGERHIDRRSDVYGLGVVAFESLTGRPLYQADTPMAVAIMHISKPAPNILDIRGELPPATADVLFRALAKAPDERYQSAGDFVRALAALVGQPGSEVEPAAPEKPAERESQAGQRGLGGEGDVRASEKDDRSPRPESTGLADPAVIPVDEESRAAPPPPDVGAYVGAEKSPSNVTLIQLGATGESDLAPVGLHPTMLLRQGLDAVISPRNDALIEDWLQMHDSEQLGHFLQDADERRIILTGYGSFGGTSLVRGVVARVADAAGLNRGGDVLAIRLEVGRRIRSGKYDLYLNENFAGPLVLPIDRPALKAAARRVLGRWSDQPTQTMIGGGFLSDKDDAIADLVGELIALVEGGGNDANLEAGLVRLCETPPIKRLILILDRIDYAEPMRRICESSLTAHPEVAVVIVSRRESYDRWPGDLHHSLSESGFAEWYVRRLWQHDLNLTAQLERLLVDVSLEANTAVQQQQLQVWLDHLAFKARGALSVALRELKDRRGWVKAQNQQQHMLNIASKYIGNREEIEHNAHVYSLLKRRYRDILESLFNDAARADRAMIGVHYVMEWIRDNPIFSRAELDEAAQSLPITIADRPALRHEVLTNLLGILEKEGYLTWREAPGSYKVMWKQAARPAPPPPPPSAPAVPQRRLRIAVLGGRDGEFSSANQLASQIAFEAVERGHHVVTTDRQGTDTLIREKLRRYLQSFEHSAEGEKSVTVIAAGSRVEKDDTAEIRQTAGALAQLDQVLASSDVLILTGGDDSPESIFAIENVYTAARNRGVPVVPVGAAGQATTALWERVTATCATTYADRASPDDFAPIGPGKTFVPEVAQAALSLAARLAGA